MKDSTSCVAGVALTLYVTVAGVALVSVYVTVTAGTSSLIRVSSRRRRAICYHEQARPGQARPRQYYYRMIVRLYSRTPCHAPMRRSNVALDGDHDRGRGHPWLAPPSVAARCVWHL